MFASTPQRLQALGYRPTQSMLNVTNPLIALNNSTTTTTTTTKNKNKKNQDDEDAAAVCGYSQGI